MKNYRIIISLTISCCILFLGCAGKSRIEIQKKLMTMSDIELINHYKMLEMRMIDIDRNREQSIQQEHDIYGHYYPGDAYYHLGHLHIGDNWNALKREKELTEIEIRRRSIFYCLHNDHKNFT